MTTKEFDFNKNCYRCDYFDRIYTWKCDLKHELTFPGWVCDQFEKAT